MTEIRTNICNVYVSQKKNVKRERVEGKTETFKKSCLTIHNKHARRFVAIRCFFGEKRSKGK